MLEFFGGLLFRSKVFVLVVVIFIAIMAIAISFLIIRVQILRRHGKKNLQVGNFSAAFTAFKRLIQIRFCSDPIFLEAAKSSDEIAIAGTQQTLSRVGTSAVLQQVIKIHREAASSQKLNGATTSRWTKKAG